MSVKVVRASAPAKVILLGGKGVNWGYPALVSAVGMRCYCTAAASSDTDRYRFSFEGRTEEGSLADVQKFKQSIDELRREKYYDKVAETAIGDFFAPVRYVLGHVTETTQRLGLDISWESEIPAGSGLGSGAAASASMVVAAMHLLGHKVEPKQVAWLAWQGDIIAHGGVGTGLDSGASALGGIVRYSLKDGPNAVQVGTKVPLVVGDTLIRASTATSNTASRNWIAEHPMRMHLLEEMGMLVDQAQEALLANELQTVGHMMNLCHLIKEKLGMSIPKIETLIEAALGAGALGAKISGKGGGGIIVALTKPGEEEAVARAIDAAGGRGLVPEVGVPGAHIETERS